MRSQLRSQLYSEVCVCRMRATSHAERSQRENREVKQELANCVNSDDLVEIFELLDSDGGGQIDVEEFVDGLTKIVTSDTPIDEIRSKKQVQLLRKSILDVSEEMERIEARVKEIEDRMERGFVELLRSLRASRTVPGCRFWSQNISIFILISLRAKIPRYRQILAKYQNADVF